jgi:hypothetical protein
VKCLARKQVIVELVLRQQLDTYDLRKTKPRLTPIDRVVVLGVSHLRRLLRDCVRY